MTPYISKRTLRRVLLLEYAERCLAEQALAELQAAVAVDRGAAGLCMTLAQCARRCHEVDQLRAELIEERAS